MPLDDAKDGGFQGGNLDHPATFISPSQRKAYDKGVSFEEYIYYAERTRAEQKEHLPNPEKAGGLIAQVLRRKSVSSVHGQDSSSDSPGADTTQNGEKVDDREGRAVITDDEWRNASRMMRTASW